MRVRRFSCSEPTIINATSQERFDRSAGRRGLRNGNGFQLQHETRAVEVLVDGDSWKIIRRRENFNTLIQSMVDLN